MADNTSLDDIISISVSTGGALVAEDNPNVCCLVSSNVDVLSTANRANIYKSASSVETDFGTNSAEYQHALTFFGQNRTPVGVGGYLVIGFWRSVDENVAATAGNVVGGQLTESSVISALQTVTDGSFDITIDGGVAQNITGLDFQTSTTLEDIASLLNTNITGATVSVNANDSIVIISDTTGATSEVTFLTAGASGTFIGDTLKLATGTGAIKTDGVAATVLTAESKVDSITALKAIFPIKSFVFIDNPTDVESKNLAAYCQANDVTSFDVFGDEATNFTIDIANVCWDIKINGYTNYRMAFDKGNDRKFATALMSRTHVVNFDGENTSMTIQLKDLVGVTPYQYTESQLEAATKIGLDLYVSYKDVPKVRSGAGNDFHDNRYNLIAIKDALQTAYFNTLGGTTTKIPQTERGILAIKDDLTQTLKRFVKAGVIGTGLTWNGTDKFGDEATFDRNIKQEGFYILFQKLEDQLQADREARTAPVCQIAFKYAGAIHTGNIIVNIEK